jgi:uncharacterized protein YbaR (Trm112 family)
VTALLVHIELIDLLRCPASHAVSTLVLTAGRWDGRRVIEGTLGCPVCRAEYPIRSGVTDFAGGTSDRAQPIVAEPSSQPEAAMRLAAQLDLQEPGAVVVLAGSYARLAFDLVELVQARCLAVNAPAAVSGADGILVVERLPLATAALRGTALDDQNATPALLAEVVRALGTGGRLVVSAATGVPAGVDVLARDATEWVASVRKPASALVSLGRRAPQE